MIGRQVLLWVTMPDGRVRCGKRLARPMRGSASVRNWA